MDDTPNLDRLPKPIFADPPMFYGPIEYMGRFGALNEAQRVLFPTMICLEEVCNGGFWQLFWNSAGVMAPEAVRGYKALGMPRMAEAVTRAMKKLGPTFPRDRKARQDILDTVHANMVSEGIADPIDRFFDDEDTAIYKLYETENRGFYPLAEALASG